MKKIHVIILLLIIVSTILAFAESHSQKKVGSDDLVTITTTLSNVTPYDIDWVKGEAIRALDEICPLLGIKKKQIKIQIVEKGISNAYGGIVSIRISLIKRRKAPVVHEVTHVLAKHEDNRFFSEGLAVYFQERFGQGDHGAFNTEGRPLDDFVRSYKDNFMPINKLSNNNDIFRQIGTVERKIAYMQAGSFIKYLAEVFGDAKLKALHDTWTLNFKKIYGKGLKELEVEWKKHALNNEQRTLKTYIKIQVPDKVSWGGKLKYRVSPGDMLQVLRSKPCMGGSVECWEVKNTKTGEKGFVNADMMRRRHNVYED